MKNTHPLKKFFQILVIVIAASLIYLTGYSVGHKNLTFENKIVPKIANLNYGKPADVNFALFWDAWAIVKNKFYGGINNQKMVYGAISGMMDSLKDPYSLFMDPDDAKRFSDDLSGSFGGIGAQLESKNNMMVIVAPLADSPAQKAGLKAQDIIIKVDGTEVSQLGFYEAINKIRGEKDTKVKLTIAREGWEETKDFEITRDIVVVKSVKYEIKDNIGIITMSQFGDDTLDLMKEAVDALGKKNVEGMIIDLRNNPGGYLQDAIDITSMFVDNGSIIVKEKDKAGSVKTFKTTLDKKFDKPVVMLVNGGSASASEIFAGAMQDLNRAKLVGEKTFGKGSVQTVEELKDGSKVRVTIAHWLTPNDREIDKEGIKPDISIELTDQDKENKVDSQLNKAIEILH